MNVEIEVTRCVRSTYLVQNAKSLEDAERSAMDLATKKLAGTTGVQKTGTSKPESFVTWSRPVIVRGGEIVEEEE